MDTEIDEIEVADEPPPAVQRCPTCRARIYIWPCIACGLPQHRRTDLKTELTSADHAGIYLCDRGAKADIVCEWDGRKLHMANHANSPGLPLDLFTNFRRLAEQKPARKSG